MPYNSKQDAVSALLPGYRVVGEKPNVVKTANPNAGRPGEPATIDEPQGIILSVQGPGGEPDEIVVKEVGNNPNSKGGVGYDVVTGPTKAPAKTSTPLGELQFLDKDFQPTTDASKRAFVRDPKAPPGTQPYKIEGGSELGDPSTWTPIQSPNDPKVVIGLYDPQSKKVAASVTAPTGAKDTDPSTWTPVYRKPGDASSGIIAQYDPVNHDTHPVAATPDGKQVVITDTAIYVVDKDTGKSTLAQTVDKTQPVSVVTHPDGSIYYFDPNEKDKTKALTKMQGAQPPQTYVQKTPGGDVTLVYDPESKSYKLPPGATMPTSVDAPGATALEWIITRDDKGKEISREKNPNYRPPQTTQGAQSTAARQIQQWNPQAGQWEWVENKGRVVASDALRNMASQLTGQVVAGDISEDEATKLITAANARMANDLAEQNQAATAAGNVLTNTRGNAQTAAGLLQSRAQAATGTLQSIVGNALSNKNITSIPGDVGANLVGGLQGWTADLMGGQATMDSAARMIQAADPQSNLADPTTQAAISTLRQMLDKHAELTGQPHPAVAATQAAQQSQQTGGMVAPGGYNPKDIQWNQPPQNAPGRTMGPGGVITGGMTPGSQWGATGPMAGATLQTAPVASGFTAPLMQLAGQNYGAGTAYTGGVAPWLAQPQAAFVAPMPPPLTAQAVLGGR